MAISDELFSQFAKITKDTKESSNESTSYATVVIQNERVYVKLDGSNVLTPVSSTTTALNDDRVLVMIKNHSAVITGNLTAPSASAGTIEEVNQRMHDFEVGLSGKASQNDLESLSTNVDGISASLTTTINNLTQQAAAIQTILSTYVDTTTFNSLKTRVDTIENSYTTSTQLNAQKLRIDAHDLNFERVQHDITNLKMLGWIIPSLYEEYNYETADGIFHQKISRVNLGTLTWLYHAANNYFYVEIPNMIDRSGRKNGYIRSPYTYNEVAAANLSNMEYCFAQPHKYRQLTIRNTSYTDAASFKTAMNGVYLYFVLASEVVKNVDGNERNP